MTSTTDPVEKLEVDESEGDPLPAGPRLPSVVQALATLGAPMVWFPAMRKRFGPEFTMRFAPMHRLVVVMSRPSDLRDVFRGDPEVFQAGRGNVILKPLLGEHSLLTQDGEDHARARRLLMPAFGRREISGYRDLVREVAATELAKWPDDGKVKAHLLLNALTLEVILRVIFGVTDTRRLERMRPLVRDTIEVGPVVAIGASIPRLENVPPWKSLNHKRAELIGLIHEEIDLARTDPQLAERTDLLARLVLAEDRNGEHLSDAELVDQLMTLVMAGHETTASALSWTLLEVAHRLDVQQHAMAAMRDDEDEGRAYLDGVIKETLRVHPVVSLVMRQLRDVAEVGGRTYARNITLAPNIVLAHQDPANHPDPEEFRPQRYFGDAPSPTAWLPFGGGARRCIGAAFALMEGEEILRQILTRWNVYPNLKRMEPARSRNVTTFPAFRARVTLRRRPAPSPAPSTAAD